MQIHSSNSQTSLQHGYGAATTNNQNLQHGYGAVTSKPYQTAPHAFYAQRQLASGAPSEEIHDVLISIFG